MCYHKVQQHETEHMPGTWTELRMDAMDLPDTYWVVGVELRTVHENPVRTFV